MLGRNQITTLEGPSGDFRGRADPGGGALAGESPPRVTVLARDHFNPRLWPPWVWCLAAWSDRLHHLLRAAGAFREQKVPPAALCPGDGVETTWPSLHFQTGAHHSLGRRSFPCMVRQAMAFICSPARRVFSSVRRKTTHQLMAAFSTRRGRTAWTLQRTRRCARPIGPTRLPGLPLPTPSGANQKPVPRGAPMQHLTPRRDPES